MKASYVVFGLLLAVCFAQDTFFEDARYTLINGGHSEKDVDNTVYLNGHTYVLSSINYQNGNHLNSDYGSDYPDTSSNNHLIVLIDLTGKKSVFLGEIEGGVSYFTAGTLCTDGTYLYASLRREGGNPTLKDKFETTNKVSSAVYKIDKDLNLVDRVAAVDQGSGVVTFSSCSVTADKTPIFMVTTKLDSNVKSITLKHNDKTPVNFPATSVYGAFFFGDVFVDEPVLLSSVASEGEDSVSGSILGSGDGDTFFASVTKGKKLEISLLSVKGSSHLLSSDELTLSKNIDDHISIVRLSSTSFATVFGYAGSIEREGTKLLNGGDSDPYLVFVKHQISGNAITFSELKSVAIGTNVLFNKFTTLVLHQSIDNKIILASHYLAFNVPFCGTTLYTNITSSSGHAAMVLATVDADSMDCLSAQVLDPVANQAVKGLVALPNDKIALTEVYDHPSGTRSVVQTLTLDYERCEDGVMDFSDKKCVCFDGGKDNCKNRVVNPSSSSFAPGDSSSSHPQPSSSHAQPSSSHAQPSSSQAQPSSTQPSGSSEKPEKSSSSVAPPPSTSSQLVESESSVPEDKSPILAIVLIALTGLFLVTAVIFVVLFIVG